MGQCSKQQLRYAVVGYENDDQVAACVQLDQPMVHGSREPLFRVKNPSDVKRHSVFSFISLLANIYIE